MYLYFLLVELSVVWSKFRRLFPGALSSLEVIVVVVSSLHPMFHPFTTIIPYQKSLLLSPSQNVNAMLRYHQTV